MEVINEQEMAARLDFRSPLHEPKEPPVSLWCIPFEYGGLRKGTRISISKAKEIAAELRAAVAEEEKLELKRAFDREKERADEAGKRNMKAMEDNFRLEQEVALLKRRLRHEYGKKVKSKKR
jgi:hypothetical protein